MAKKLKKEMDDKQLLQGILDSAQQIWLAGLAVFARAQSEGSKLFDSLVKEGAAIEARTKKSAEATVEDLRGRVEEAKGKASSAWDNLEKVFEDRVARALGRLGVPVQREMRALEERLANLEARLEQLATAPATPTPAKARRPGRAKTAAAAAAEAEAGAEAGGAGKPKRSSRAKGKSAKDAAPETPAG
ncbi:MAG TPA: phasin family protein [Candidatus Competibacteraceae bacterium]|nr:phasin family protein [Candidatus Competibacteraceae bacterium]